MALERFVALEINSQLLFGMVSLPFSEQECITQHPDEVPCKQSVFPVKSFPAIDVKRPRELS